MSRRKERTAQPEDVEYGSPRFIAIVRALNLAGVNPDTVSTDGLRVYRNHIEYEEIQRHHDGGILVNLRDFCLITKRRVVRNPNPRLAAVR